MRTGILPHINRLCLEDRVKKYHIQLNCTNGENIRLPLLVTADNASNVAREIDDYFTSYFSSLPATEEKNEDHPHKLFMDFPCNTIQYGLYSVEKGDPVLQQRLSHVIIESLCTDIKDDATLVRLAFYLYVTLLQVATRNTGLSFNQLLTIEYCFYTDIGETDDTGMVKQFFVENKHMLFNTCCNLMKLPEGLPAWVYQWAAVCESKLKNTIANNKTLNAKKSVFDEITYYIDKQINLSKHVKLLLFHFIRQITSV